MTWKYKMTKDYYLPKGKATLDNNKNRRTFVTAINKLGNSVGNILQTLNMILSR
jgi:hypothetical protein